MRRSKFIDAQKAFILKQAEEGTTISDVALATGFSSLSHFSTAFLRKFGVSPSKLAFAEYI